MEDALNLIKNSIKKTNLKDKNAIAIVESANGILEVAMTKNEKLLQPYVELFNTIGNEERKLSTNNDEYTEKDDDVSDRKVHKEYVLKSPTCTENSIWCVIANNLSPDSSANVLRFCLCLATPEWISRDMPGFDIFLNKFTTTKFTHLCEIINTCEFVKSFKSLFTPMFDEFEDSYYYPKQLYQFLETNISDMSTVFIKHLLHRHNNFDAQVSTENVETLKCYQIMLAEYINRISTKS